MTGAYGHWRRAWLLLLVLAAPAVFAAASTPAEEYFKVRELAQVINAFTTEQVETQPDLFAGKLLEVRGTISAIAGSDAQTTLLVATRSGGTPTMVALPPDKRPLDWPFLDVGIGVRLLCQVVKLDGSSLGSLELAIPVKEYDAAALETQRAKSATRSPKPLTTTPSKELYTDQELTEIYGNALRYFNARLSDSDARFLASRIIAESRTHGLDARLFVAVVAIEGTLHRALITDRGAYLGNQTARGALAKMALDLRRRIARAKPSKDGLNSTTSRALAERRRNLANGKPVTRKEAEAYVNRITRLYVKMCGVDGADEVDFYSEAPDYEAKWRARRWGRPPSSLVGTWVAATASLLAVVNSNGTGVFGLNGDKAGHWFASSAYLEFRSKGSGTQRFKWRLSDDRKALTLVRIAPDSTTIATFTLLRR